MLKSGEKANQNQNPPENRIEAPSDARAAESRFKKWMIGFLSMTSPRRRVAPSTGIKEGRLRVRIGQDKWCSHWASLDGSRLRLSAKPKGTELHSINLASLASVNLDSDSAPKRGHQKIIRLATSPPVDLHPISDSDLDSWFAAFNSIVEHTKAPPPRLFWVFTPLEWSVLGVVLLFASLTHFPYLSHPAAVCFDEGHFGGFVSDYLRGICFFDIHPPLGKLIIAAAGKLCGYDGSFNFTENDAPYETNFYIYLRLPPAICATLVSPLLTGALILKDVPLVPCVLSGFLLAIDFTSIAQGRLILTDGILYFFIALTIFATSFVENWESWGAIIVQALSAACAGSVKFTGFCVLVPVAFSHFRLLFGRDQSEIGRAHV
jgi:hypothetical protein